MKKKVKKYAEGGYTEQSIANPARTNVGGGGLSDIVNTAQGLIGNVGQFNKQMVGGGGGFSGPQFKDWSAIPEAGQTPLTTALGQLGYKKGGKVSSASKRGDGIAQRGKTKGRIV